MTEAETNEAESVAWMRALQAGDDDAMRALVARWQAPLLRFVFRYVQSEAEARDLVHETFVRVHTQRAKFREGASFRSWLLTIAANLARNRRRWWRRHPSTIWFRREEDDRDAERVCPRAAPDDHAMRSERVAAVRAALAVLPHDLKVALLLYEYEDLGYREIAEVIGCSERGVETRLTRARERMRAALGEFLRAETGAAGVAVPTLSAET